MMNGNCLDIGIIQAFLDGELTSDVSMNVAGHVADCDACSILLAEAEEESALVFPVLEREMNTLVPTQRLWTRINESIAVERENTPFWKKVLAGIAAQIVNPSIAVAASVLIVFGVFAAFYTSRTNNNAPGGQEIALNAGRTSSPTQPAPISTAVDDSRTEGSVPTVSKTVNSENTPKPVAIRADYRKGPNTPPIDRGPDPVNAAGYLPGEESYVKTIADLSQSVEGQQDSAMRPSQRISYERDLAVVDDSIKRMRKEVQKNPKNESAKQVLYSSYQNKIDLLNSVAQREEMVSLK